MKKAVLAALGILTVTCAGSMPLGSFAMETEITAPAMENQGTEAERQENVNETETDLEEESPGAEEDTYTTCTEETEEPAVETKEETDVIFVLMVLPREEALPVYEEDARICEETVICPVLISRADLDELGEIGEEQIYYWTVSEEDPEEYLRASLVDGTLIFEVQESEKETESGTVEAQEYEAGNTDAAEEEETEESTENAASSASGKKKSSSSSSRKKSSAKSASGKTSTKTGSAADLASADPSSGKNSAEKKSSSSAGKSSGKHKSRSYEDAGDAETNGTAGEESSVEEAENAKHMSSGKKEASKSAQEQEASEEEKNEDISKETETDPAGTLPAAAGISGLLAAAFVFLKHRKK